MHLNLILSIKIFIYLKIFFTFMCVSGGYVKGPTSLCNKSCSSHTPLPPKTMWGLLVTAQVVCNLNCQV
jgi:hypothetical protein